jgi:quinolinate synthase
MTIALPVVPPPVVEERLSVDEKRQLISEIDHLRTKYNAVILAHSYQVPELQDIADFVGDSLGLSRQAAATEAEVIVFCGVHFMAETAAILSPEKTVLLPDLNAGCSLASSITADQLRQWKTEHPGAVVVSYVNTTAEVKAESDYCCTSANAVQIVESIPEDQEILFLPDLFLGEWVKRETGRTNIQLWLGECHVHAGIVAEDVERARDDWPDAELLIHPECACGSKCMLDLQSGRLDASRTRVLSTEGMVRHAVQSESSQFVVATETGVLHRLNTLAPGKEFRAVRDSAVCGFMKLNNLSNVRDSLKYMQFHVTVPDDVAVRARVAIDRMVSIG